MDPWVFLSTRDMRKRSTMQGIAATAQKLQNDLDLNRARMIANEVGKLFKGQ